MANPTLPLRAVSDSKFYRRFILMGIGALGFAGWCVYDGAVRWPHELKVYTAYHEIPELDRVEKWPEVAVQNGWPADQQVPKKAHDEGAMLMQFVMAVPIALVGLWFLASTFMARGNWIEATESGVTSSWGQSFRWDEVTELDKKKWRNKGIAKVRYVSDGNQKSFVIDDFKFTREQTDLILIALEDRIDHEKIVNGPSEAETLRASQATEANAPEA